MASADKTEKPTPKKRRDAREKGQIARSKDLATSLVFLTAVLVIGFSSSIILVKFQLVLVSYWKEFLAAELDLLTVQKLLRQAVFSVMKLAAPLVLLTLLVGFGAFLAQGGILLSSHNLKPKFKGLNPKNNLQRVFSKQGLVQLAKSLLLVGVIGYVGYQAVIGFMPKFRVMGLMDLTAMIELYAGFLFSLTLKVALVLVVVGAADFAFQKFKFEEDLKQTKEEVKEDIKQTEGNPLVKSRIRRLQREMARKRMMADVPEADVVITNPTHYAVALKYDLETMAAPRVLAKGRGFLARKIKELAEEHGVPLVENVHLAQSLYKSARVGDEIPAELYRAVAQVLAYIFKLKEENWH